MLPKSHDKSLKDGPRTLGAAKISSQRISRRSPLNKLGIGAVVAASVVVGLGGPAEAQSPGLMAKIQLATQAYQTNRTTTLSRARTERSKPPQVVRKSK